MVAFDGRVMVVVEVRYRKRARDGHPLETVTHTKAARLRRAARSLAAREGNDEVRIDVVAILGSHVELVENAVDFTST